METPLFLASSRATASNPETKPKCKRADSRRSILAFGRNNRNVRTAGQTVALESHHTVNQSKERMIFAQTYILSRMVLGTPLTYNNIACSSHLATEKFHTQAFAF